MSIQQITTILDAIRTEVGKVIVGQKDVVELLLTSLLCGGHVLLEGVPGTGKTLLVQSFAVSMKLDFGRIRAPVRASYRCGASPHEGVVTLPVAESNCGIERCRGEQLEVKEQSAG